MMIGGHDVPMSDVVKYVRAIKYNLEVGTEATDAMQRRLHDVIFKNAGVHLSLLEQSDREFAHALDVFIEDMVYGGD